MENQQNYVQEYLIEWAKVLSSCPKDRLPLVLQLFEHAGNEPLQTWRTTAKQKGVDAGRRIADVRSKYGISVSEIASECGLTRTRLSNYANGSRTPNSEATEKIMDAIDRLIAMRGEYADDEVEE